MTEPPQQPRRLALFDMDRTLVRKDTASLYVRYQRDNGEVGLYKTVRVAWWLLQYTLGVINAEKVAEQALRDFAGKRESWMEESCRDWYRRYVRMHICDLGREAVERHRRQGDVLMLVTGATRYAAEPLAEELGIEHVICTRLQVDADGCFTGRVVKPMCYGRDKITLTHKRAEQIGADVTTATFYSDSITDLPLLEHVQTPIVVNPDARLRRTARRRGWPIETW